MEFLFNNRWLLLTITLSLCIYGIKFIPTALQSNNDLRAWFDSSDPALEDYYELQNLFGNDRVITLAYYEKEGVLEKQHLKKIQKLEAKLLEIEGVHKVLSILNVKDFIKQKKDQNISMKFTSYFDNGLDSLSENSYQKILSSLYSGRLINAEGNIVLIIIQFEKFDLVQGKMKSIIPLIKSTSFHELGENKVHFGGAEIITFELNQLSMKDFVSFTGIGFALMFVLIALFFKRLIYVVLVLLIAFTTIWLTLCIYGFLGFGVNIFTIITPVISIIISVIVSMHILNEFEASVSRSSESGEQKAVFSLKKIAKPCFYAIITTMIGFLSLLSSNTAVLKEFGWLSALTCFLAFIMAFLWSGVILPHVTVNKQHVERTYRLGKMMGKNLGLILNNTRSIWCVSIVVSLVAILGVSKMKIDMNPIDYFPKDHRVIKDHNFMQSNWGNYFPIDIILETNSPFKIDDYPILSAMEDFDAQIVDNNLASNTFSYVKVMDSFAKERFNKPLSYFLDSPYRLKTLSNSFKKLKLEEEEDILVSADRTKARITITGSVHSIRELEVSINKMKEISRRIFKNHAQIQVSGYPALNIKIMNKAFDSLKSSLFVAFILLFIVILLIFKSFKIAAIAMIINVFPVLIMLGFLGYANINLDLATSTIAAIILGVAIDDTIHILHRYQLERGKDLTVEQALKTTHFRVGRVVLLSSLVLFFGFSILMFASLKTVFFFGLLCVISVIATLYGDLIILSLFLKNLK